jgi:hypothetical protein
VAPGRTRRADRTLPRRPPLASARR